MTIELITDPKKYFQKLVFDALKNQKVEASPATELYLVYLLQKFILAAGNLLGSPLTFIIKEAMEEETPLRERINLFRHTGDLSLYTAGFFGEFLSRKLVGVSYYIEMGSFAYSTVSSMTCGAGSRMYQELADKIGTFVGVFSEVGEITLDKKSHKNIIQQYELWIETGSKRSEALLKKSGITPNKTFRTKLQ